MWLTEQQRLVPSAKHRDRLPFPGRQKFSYNSLVDGYSTTGDSLYHLVRSRE